MWRWTTFGIAIVFISAAIAQPPCRLQPMQQAYQNLIRDSSITGSSEIRLLGIAFRDSTTSFQNDGSGAVVLPYQPDTLSRLLIYKIPLQRSIFQRRYYTFSAMARSAKPFSVVLMVCAYMDTLSQPLHLAHASTFALTRSDTWQEIALVLEPPEEAAYVTIYIDRFDGPENDGFVWIDQLYFGPGVRFRSPPAEKIAFDGINVKVDCRGKMQHYTPTGWKPLFPIAIYSTHPGRDWRLYREQGFNTYIWAWNYQQFRKAAQSGLFVGFNITRFVSNNTPDSRYYGDTATLRQELTRILTDSLRNHLIFYYWDNEDYDEREMVQHIVAFIRSLEHDLVGGPWCPVYALQGHAGIARMFNGIVDLSGTYFSRYNGNIHDAAAFTDAQLSTEPTRWWMLQFLEDQQTIPFLAQLNYYRQYADFRTALWRSLLAGAGGIGYYKDPHYPTGIPLDLLPWWQSLPVLLDTLKQLLPALYAPPDTAITIEVASREQVDCLDWTVRYTDTARFLLLFNHCSDPVTATIVIPPASENNFLLFDGFTHTFIDSVRSQSERVIPPGTLQYFLLKTPLTGISTSRSAAMQTRQYGNELLVQLPAFFPSWSIYNVQGEKIAEGTLPPGRTTLTLPLPFLSSGIYWFCTSSLTQHLCQPFLWQSPR